MNLALRALRKAIQAPGHWEEYIEERRKKEYCATGEGVRLYPTCSIDNFQMEKSAIVIQKRCHIRGKLRVFGHGGRIQIGETCYVGENSYIWSSRSITIGDRVLISHGVNIHDNIAHSLSASARAAHFRNIISIGPPVSLDDIASAPIVIEDDAWIGFNTTILKGVTIGKGAVVGAASLITRDVAAFTIVVGNPPRVIGMSTP